MASRKELKKNINYIAGELFTECLVNSLYVPGTDKQKADMEYDKFKVRTANELTPVEIHFLENFEKEQKKLKQ